MDEKFLIIRKIVIDLCIVGGYFLILTDNDNNTNSKVIFYTILTNFLKNKEKKK